MALFDKDVKVTRGLGMDISTAGGQYPVNFETAYSAGARFVVMKSETGLNPIDAGLTQANVDAARAAGLPVGFYHYCLPSVNGQTTAGAELEANHFIDNLYDALGGSDFGDLYLACDFEDAAVTWVDNDEAYDYLEAFNNKVIERTGKRCFLYTAYYIVDDITGSTPGSELIHSTKGAIANIMPLWLAANEGSADYNFTAFGGYDSIGYSAWQFSSDGNGRGSEFGVSSADIDLDHIGDLGVGMLSVPHKTYGLTATAGDEQVTLNWDKSFHEDIVSYKVYCDGVVVDTVSSPTTTSTITSLTNNLAHDWQIAAVDSYDEGEKSEIVTMAATGAVAATPTNGTLSYQAASVGGDMFENVDGRTVIVIVNGSASPITATINNQTNCNYGYDDNIAVSIPAYSKYWFGLFDKKRFNNGQSAVEVTYSSVTSVVVASAKV